MNKQCTKCKIDMATTEFSKSKRDADGLQDHCKICMKKYQAERYLKNKNKINEQNKAWYYENHEKRNASIRKYQKERESNDLLYKLIKLLRIRTTNSLKSKKWNKTSHFMEYIGCDKQILTNHFESQFKDGMNWDNHGDKDNQWSIDHIIPLSSAKTVDELYKLCHYTNLQPLWHVDNLKKSNKL
jgi:hypothetical protein